MCSFILTGLEHLIPNIPLEMSYINLHIIRPFNFLKKEIGSIVFEGHFSPLNFLLNIPKYLLASQSPQKPQVADRSRSRTFNEGHKIRVW